MALKLVPDDVNIAFVKWRRIYFIFSMLLFVVAVGVTGKGILTGSFTISR